MRLMTWNINSIRLRIDLVARLTERFRPDILCLQETKVIDDLFPGAALADMGYRHQAIRGMKGYNGVAILSRRPFAATGSLDWCRREDCRHVSATLKNGIEIHNFYVPSGGDIPDAGTNQKFAHKLEFLRQVAAWCRAGRGEGEGGGARRILVGDLNIAPLDNDVWSHRQMRNVVSHTEIEISHLERLRKAGSWTDAVRYFYGDDEKLFSWWSYRARDWAASDRGRRLDHIWVSPALAPKLKGADILSACRGWNRPSDHVPVSADFKR